MGTTVENAGTIICDFSPQCKSNTWLKPQKKKKEKKVEYIFFGGVHCDIEVKDKYFEERNRLPMQDSFYCPYFFENILLFLFYSIKKCRKKKKV